MPAKINYEEGTVFGELTIIGSAPSFVNKARWRCLCSCGNTTEVYGQELRRKTITSCGRCGWQKKYPSEYAAWSNMHARCGNPAHKQYKDYGARGIKVCKEWYSFAKFLQDMGPKPFEFLTLERNDNDKGYSPENCSWETMAKQNGNKRLAA